MHRIVPTGRTPEVFFAHDGTYESDDHWYLNNIYRREQERGYGGLEDLWNPGMVRWSLTPGQTVHFICSADPINFKQAVELAGNQGKNTQTIEKNAVLPALLRSRSVCGQHRSPQRRCE